MPIVQRSLLRRLLKGVPIPLLALLFGLVTGLAVSVSVDRAQTRAMAEIFAEELDNQLHQRARESLIGFDRYRQSYSVVTRLLANHRRMADYLSPITWYANEPDVVIRYARRPPPWLPESDIWSGVIRPSHLLLVDNQGRIREEYRLREGPAPQELWLDAARYLAASQGRSHMTKLDGKPYLVTSELAENARNQVMGSLVLLVPIDSQFLGASQQRVGPSDALVALVDADIQRVLSSSDVEQLPAGAGLAGLRTDFVVTAQSFFEYDDSDLNLLFATLVPRAGVAATGQRVLDLERRQRLIGSGIIILAFVLLFVLLSSRLNRLLQRVAAFSRRALDVEQPLVTRGNQLLILEDWIRDFVALVLRAREEMRARHETEMRESEALTAALMDTSLDSIITIDQRGRIIEFNPTAQRIFGHARADALGKLIDTLLLAAESRASFNQRLYESLARGRDDSDPARFELRALNHEGASFPVELAIKPMLLHDRLLFTVYIHDISDRKRQEAEIKSLAAIPSESPIPVLRVNRPGVVIYANGPSEPLLRHWGCHRLQTLPVYWKTQVLAVLDEGRTRELELRTDGGIYSLLLAPIRELGYVNIYARDITKMRAAEEEARRRQNELIHVARLSTMGEMATGIAHELNQPLSAIVNFANGIARRLKLGVGDKDDLLQAVQQISAQANRAGEIIKRLRSMVSRQQPVREEADLNQLIAEVCAILGYETRKLGLVVERRLFPQPLLIRADAVQIEQVMLNLMRNALDALQEVASERRSLIITSGRVGQEAVYVAVFDNGPGIRPQVMERLFDPFFTTKKDGMGMGLAITQTIVANHHGKIRADSLPGKGTTFTLELPAAAESVKSLAS